MDAQFVEGMAEIMEIDTGEVTPEFSLTSENWDSLAIVSTIALVDECYDVMLNGPALGKCGSIAEVVALIEKAKGGK